MKKFSFFSVMVALTFMFGACNKSVQDQIEDEGLAIGTKALFSVGSADFYEFGMISAQEFAKLSDPFNNGELFLLKEGNSIIRLWRQDNGNGLVYIEFANVMTYLNGLDGTVENPQVNFSVRYKGSNNVAFTFYLPASDNQIFALGDKGTKYPTAIENPNLKSDFVALTKLNENNTKLQAMGDVTQVRLLGKGFTYDLKKSVIVRLTWKGGIGKVWEQKITDGDLFNCFFWTAGTEGDYEGADADYYQGCEVGFDGLNWGKFYEFYDVDACQVHNNGLDCQKHWCHVLGDENNRVGFGDYFIYDNFVDLFVDGVLYIEPHFGVCDAPPPPPITPFRVRFMLNNSVSGTLVKDNPATIDGDLQYADEIDFTGTPGDCKYFVWSLTRQQPIVGFDFTQPIEENIVLWQMEVDKPAADLTALQAAISAAEAVCYKGLGEAYLMLNDGSCDQAAVNTLVQEILTAIDGEDWCDHDPFDDGSDNCATQGANISVKFTFKGVTVIDRVETQSGNPKKQGDYYYHFTITPLKGDTNWCITKITYGSSNGTVVWEK